MIKEKYKVDKSISILLLTWIYLVFEYSTNAKTDANKIFCSTKKPSDHEKHEIMSRHEFFVDIMMQSALDMLILEKFQ